MLNLNLQLISQQICANDWISDNWIFVGDGERRHSVQFFRGVQEDFHISEATTLAMTGHWHNFARAMNNHAVSGLIQNNAWFQEQGPNFASWDQELMLFVLSVLLYMLECRRGGKQDPSGKNMRAWIFVFTLRCMNKMTSMIGFYSDFTFNRK
jgi:hypothetical protein